MKIFYAAFACLTLVSCNNRNSNPSNEIEEGDSCSEVVTPHDVINPNQVGKEITTIGVTLDRAMNSILIIDENGDSAEFEYAEVDNRTKIFGSNIGDTVTVKHVKLSDGRDSVTAIYRGRRP